MSIDLRAPTESDLDRDRALAEYRKSLHRGEDVSVEDVAEKAELEYEFAKGNVSIPSTPVQLPVAPQVTQQVVPPNPWPIVSGMMPISGVFLSGLNAVPEPVIDEEQRKERLDNMGNKVLRHVNAHETERLGELSEGIREKMDYLKKNASFTNDQWKCFAELNQQLDELIGDPYDPESTEPN